MAVRKPYYIKKSSVLRNSHKIELESARARNDEVLYSIIYEINKYGKYKGYDQIDKLYLENREFKQLDRSIINYIKNIRYNHGTQ